MNVCSWLSEESTKAPVAAPRKGCVQVGSMDEWKVDTEALKPGVTTDSVRSLLTVQAPLAGFCCVSVKT